MEFTQFEKEIINVFATHHPLHSAAEIADSYERLKSFDSVLLAIKMAANLGFSLLRCTNALKDFIKRRKKK